MELEFRKRQLKPGDAEYEYDKAVDFAPAEEENEWDEEDD